MTVQSEIRPYTELFRERGTAYDRAMQKYPRARDAEFQQAVTRAGLRSGMIVADVPAGGGYLDTYLPAGVACLGHEPCASFTHHGAEAGHAVRSLLPLPWADGSVDAVISLAGVHHIDDKRPLMTEVARVARPGGRFVLSDVAEDSPVSRFLDGFVGDHNSTGHEGVFLGPRTLRELQETGWLIRSAEQVRYHWAFDDRATMADFCRGLFDICKASPEQVGAAIEAGLGVDELEDGRIGMRWSLMTIVADKPGG